MTLADVPALFAMLIGAALIVLGLRSGLRKKEDDDDA